MLQSNTETLIERLNGFIRKYYKNQLIRGGIYFSALSLVVFLLVIVLEYFGHYQSGVRMALFYIFIAATLYFLARFIAMPLAGLFRIGKTLSHKEASEIIGNHFPEVKDKLLNTLQLKEDSGQQKDNSLLAAAIAQKTAQLSPVPFMSAIDLKKNVRYARYVLAPVALYLVVYLVSPGMITDGGKRILRYNETFKPVAPFTFGIENDDLTVEQFSEFRLEVTVSGKELPGEVYVVKDENRFKMQRIDNTHFTYTFNSVKEETPFLLEAGGFLSDEYKIDVVAKAQLINYQVKVHYPPYLGRKDDVLNSPGDIVVPAGSQLSWKFITKQTDELELGFNGSVLKAEQKEKDLFLFSKKFFLSADYFIKVKNARAQRPDSMQYAIEVIPDAYPEISVEEKSDSLNARQRYFIGDVNDDHGITKLTFNYRYVKSENPAKTAQGLQSRALPPERQASLRFYHQLFMDEIGLEPSDELEYFFEVWDNDGVHGPKSSKSRTMLFKAPSVKEMEEKTEAGNSQLKDKMESAIKEAKSMQKDLKSLDQKMQEKKELTWEEKKNLDNLLDRQKKLTDQIDQIKKEQKKNSEEEQEYKKQNEEILQKQEQLEKMFNEVMNDEMKKLIQQLEQMMQQQNKDQIKQEMEKMQMNNKDVEKELDRMLEQFKQLEIEKKLEEAVNKLDKLQEKQENLAKKSEEITNDKKLGKEEKKEKLEELKKEQEKAAEEFKELQKELNNIEKKNEELENKKELENTEKEEEEISKEMKDSKESLEKEDSKSASQKQKKASQKMKEMSDKMKQSMKAQEKEEAELNTEALREILENTIQLSKDQEQLMEEFRQISGYNPQYVEMAKTQKKIKDNAKIIEDSLLALSKKVPEIRAVVNREVSRMNEGLDRSVAGYGVRNFGVIRTQQQQAMTHANNLGVMLSEILDQMQQDQQSGSSGKSGDKPKKGKGKGQGKGKSMGSLKKMQEELNKQLREGLNKQGKGEQKEGEGQGMGSKDFARMAAQQMAIRQQMQKMLSEMDAKEKEQMGGNGKIQEMQKLMEQTEKDLFNKRLSTEMIRRQEDILTRLLESEKAERKQEQDKKREAEQAKDKPRQAPPSFEPYLQQKKKEQEMLETIPAEMQPYYREKAKKYFNTGAGRK